MAKKNDVIEGQMSIFDFLAPPEPQEEIYETPEADKLRADGWTNMYDKTPPVGFYEVCDINNPKKIWVTQYTGGGWWNPNGLRMSWFRPTDYKSDEEIYQEAILHGTGFDGGKKRVIEFFAHEYDDKKRAEFLKKEYGVGGWSTDYGCVDCNASGLDFKYNEKFEKSNKKRAKLVHSGWPMVAKEIERLIQLGFYKEEICKFSEHTCNKEELWRVAIEIDVDCPKTCCRACDIKDCGARCNGAPKEIEPPILLHEGQMVYQILRCEIIPYKVGTSTWVYNTCNDGKKRNYDLLTLDEHPTHSICGNDSINNGTYLNLEDAKRWQAKMIEIFGDELLPAENMKIEKVVAYSYIHSDFYKNGTDKEVINFYAILDNGMIYLHTGSKYEHCYNNVEVGIEEFEKDKAELLKHHKDITDLSEYEPVLQNMYKSGHDTWDWSEARYCYMGVNNGYIR